MAICDPLPAIHPYLQFSSEQEIAARLRYLVENVTMLLPDGKVGVLPPEPHGKMMELFQNVSDENAHMPATTSSPRRIF
jgi:hypothetical protein